LKILGVFVLMIGIPCVATERASAKFVFTHFNTENGDGISSKPYIFLLGLLMSQYTLTGYDASAYMVYLFHSFPSFFSKSFIEFLVYFLIFCFYIKLDFKILSILILCFHCNLELQKSVLCTLDLCELLFSKLDWQGNLHCSASLF